MSARRPKGDMTVLSENGVTITGDSFLATRMTCPTCKNALRQVAGNPELWYCPRCPEEDEAP